MWVGRGLNGESLYDVWDVSLWVDRGLSGGLLYSVWDFSLWTCWGLVLVRVGGRVCLDCGG